MDRLLGYCAPPRRGLYPPETRGVGAAADVAANPTVFGGLLRREAPVSVLFEDAEYFAFRNVKPYARLAGLVIPKRRLYQDPDALARAELPLLEDLRAIALKIVAREEPAAFARGDFLLRFHRRPFNSVDHLHLHVLAPASEAPLWTSVVFFTGGLHAAALDAVLDRVRREPAGDDPPGGADVA